MTPDRLEALNRYLSGLTPEELEALSEQEVLGMAVERPDHPGQYGFMLSPRFFSSNEHMARTMHVLAKKLTAIEDLKAKMARLGK